jgi:uncharacterized protein YecE (DUF72 family)
MRCEIRIGTSGWHYKHWCGPFYPDNLLGTAMLDFYAQRLGSVELNTTFYRLPTEAAVRQWRAGTPSNFCFAVKGSRFLTHMKKLSDPEPGLARFLPLVEQLVEKLGPIVFQLPPRWSCNIARLETFLASLPARHRYAFEFRDPSWHNREVYRLLERHNTAFCLYELAGAQSPVRITADFVYVRLHGPGKAYQGSYSVQALQAWARRIREWSKTLEAVYVYFDNDQAGYAVQNALTLQRLLAGQAVRLSA